MSILNSARGMAARGFSAASWAGAAGGTRAQAAWGAASPLKRMGAMAGAGALYGGTVGRDPGQSRLGGAMSGAMGGAALYGAGRYGRAGFRATQRNMSSRAAIGQAAGSNMGFARQAGRMAGQGAFRRMKADAMSASRFIGNSATKANQGIGRIRSTLGG